MKISKFLASLFLQTSIIILLVVSPIQVAPANSKLFTEYIGAEGKDVTFSEVPIDSKLDQFHFILSFAIDYTTSTSPPSPTNGNFSAFWDTQNLTPSRVSAIKSQKPNVKVALSLAGDTVNGEKVFFSPKSISSWVGNAILSITRLVNEYHLDGIDIDYEHFHADPNTFAECIGQLLIILKRQKVVSFASIAPYDDGTVQAHYLALWRKYGHVIDYVNFQFYAYDKGTTISQFIGHFETQRSNYKGGKLLVSFGTDESGGLKPENGFFQACARLKQQGKLDGIFIWSADDSKKDNFRFEKQSQSFLVS
ncbi:hypothetical protein FEM48_Zijuj02G0086200 [Ziziphus jujuba var. spinosa]|uniref:GH18 domain-containing protein n=1 Tax=Ziziphus jujuba var. spinosa TaxID=714518 RepID=A0A978VUQ7_ZIZJJ|nr:hypothetical protein FEM48_Zijuj02G0086200 [Ziziphus jujuba var. spinosa]